MEMGDIGDFVKRLIRYNNISYRDFADRVGLKEGTVRSSFSRGRDEVWMKALALGYELGGGEDVSSGVEKISDEKKSNAGALVGDVPRPDVGQDLGEKKMSWQERQDLNERNKNK